MMLTVQAILNKAAKKHPLSKPLPFIAMNNNHKLPNYKEEDIKVFFKHWNIYQKVIEHNYMLHKEMYDELSQCFKQLPNKPLSVLDLGCGDATIVAQALENLTVAEYCGIDLSKPALDFAAKNLEGITSNTQFIEADFAEAFETITKPYDLIIAGYALHHLSTEQKHTFFQTAKNKLNDEGCIIIYDLVRCDDESRETYLDRLCAAFQKQWAALTDEEMHLVIDHIQNNDRPEKVSFYQHIAEQYSFSDYQLRYRDQTEFYGLCYFR